MKSIKILAIDQAAKVSGWSYFEDNTPIKMGIIKASPATLKGGERLSFLRKQFSQIIDDLSPDLILIEDPVGGEEDKIGAQNNWKTMQILCQVQGVLLQLIHEKKTDVEIISPSSWQFTCGIHKRDRLSRKEGAKTFVKNEYKIANIEQDICDSICIGYHYIKSIEQEESAF